MLIIFLKNIPISKNIIAATIKTLTSLLISSGTIPPTNPLIASIAYLNGSAGFIPLKKLDITSTGNVPPEAATCNTKNTIQIALPIFPKTETVEYIIVINIKLVNIPNSTNSTGCNTYVFNINISPSVTTAPCNTPIVMNNRYFPKNNSQLVNSSSPSKFFAFTVSNETSINPPTHKESTV